MKGSRLRATKRHHSHGSPPSSPISIPKRIRPLAQQYLNDSTDCESDTGESQIVNASGDDYKSTPENPVPNKSTPANPVPNKSTPENPVPNKSTPANPLPNKSSPENPLPNKSTPENPLPNKSTPESPLPNRSTPENPLSNNSTPDNPLPHKSTPDEDSLFTVATSSLEDIDMEVPAVANHEEEQPASIPVKRGRPKGCKVKNSALSEKGMLETLKLSAIESDIGSRHKGMIGPGGKGERLKEEDGVNTSILGPGYSTDDTKIPLAECYSTDDTKIPLAECYSTDDTKIPLAERYSTDDAKMPLAEGTTHPTPRRLKRKAAGSPREPYRLRQGAKMVMKAVADVTQPPCGDLQQPETIKSVVVHTSGKLCGEAIDDVRWGYDGVHWT